MSTAYPCTIRNGPEQFVAGDGTLPVPPALTPRQQVVLHRVALGHSNKQVARGLTISCDTVKYHLKNIYTRLGVRSRIQAVVLAKARGLITSPPDHTAKPIPPGPGSGGAGPTPALRPRAIDFAVPARSADRCIVLLLRKRDCPAERPGFSTAWGEIGRIAGPTDRARESAVVEDT